MVYVLAAEEWSQRNPAPFIAIILIGLIFMGLQSIKARPVEDPTGTFVLKFGPLGIFLSLLALLGAGLLYYYCPEKKSSGYLPVLVFSGTFLLGALILFYLTLFHRLEITDDAVIKRSLFGRAYLSWDQIAEVNYRRSMFSVRLVGNAGTKISVPTLYKNFARFPQRLIRKCRSSRWEDAREGFEGLGVFKK